MKSIKAPFHLRIHVGRAMHAVLVEWALLTAVSPLAVSSKTKLILDGSTSSAGASAYNGRKRKNDTIYGLVQKNHPAFGQLPY